MNKIVKKAAAVSLAAIVSMSALTGCGSDNSVKYSVKDTKYEITDNSDVIFDLGKSTITYGEMMYFVSYFEKLGEYEKSYYQANMGYTGDFWNEVDESGNTEAQNAKNNAFQEATYVEIMKNAAIDAGVTLTDEELASVEQTAKDSYALFDEAQVANAKLTYDGFYSALKTMTYTNKYVAQLKTEYMESDAYEQALASIKKEDNLAYEANYAYVSLPSDSEKRAEFLKKYQPIFEDVRARASAGEEFGDIQKSYAEEKDVIFGSKVIKKDDDSMEPVIMNTLAALDNNDLSEILDTEYGLFIFQMINKDNEDAYQELRRENSEKVVEGMVTSKYNELSAEYNIEADEKLVESIEMGKMTIITK